MTDFREQLETLDPQDALNALEDGELLARYGIEQDEAEELHHHFINKLDELVKIKFSKGCN